MAGMPIPSPEEQVELFEGWKGVRKSEARCEI
jgi:hypothetical protein